MAERIDSRFRHGHCPGALSSGCAPGIFAAAELAIEVFETPRTQNHPPETARTA